jgi:hypothetical protein
MGSQTVERRVRLSFSFVWLGVGRNHVIHVPCFISPAEILDARVPPLPFHIMR